MTAITVLSYEPVTKKDFFAMGKAIASRATDYPNFATTSERVEFIAGKFVARCKATFEAVTNLSKRFLKVAGKALTEPKEKKPWKLEKMDLQYMQNSKTSEFEPILQGFGGKYAVIKSPDGLEDYRFFIAKSPIDGTYRTFAEGCKYNACGGGSKNADLAFKLFLLNMAKFKIADIKKMISEEIEKSKGALMA